MPEYRPRLFPCCAWSVCTFLFTNISDCYMCNVLFFWVTMTMSEFIPSLVPAFHVTCGWNHEVYVAKSGSNSKWYYACQHSWLPKYSYTWDVHCCGRLHRLVVSYQPTVCNIPEEQRFYLHCDGCLKSLIYIHMPIECQDYTTHTQSMMCDVCSAHLWLLHGNHSTDHPTTIKFKCLFNHLLFIHHWRYYPLK
jgi:hypothetical protein